VRIIMHARSIEEINKNEAIGYGIMAVMLITSTTRIPPIADWRYHLLNSESGVNINPQKTAVPAITR
jgi:hypothetical protein